MEPFLLRRADEGGDVVVAAEVEDAGPRLVEVPEDVRRDGVEAHRAGHLHPVAPVLARDARVVHLARDDLERLSVEEERRVAGGQAVRGLRSRGSRRAPADRRDARRAVAERRLG